MPRAAEQVKLIDLPSRLPNGLVYRPDFITPAEEAEILTVIDDLPLYKPRYGEYEAKRRVIGFGWGYDFEKKRFIPGPPLPLFLSKIQRKIAKWLDIPVGRVVEALITEYPPGTAIGWHRDTEEFEKIIGISFAGWARMRFRPLDWKSRRPPSARVGTPTKASEILSLELEPRSAYIMQKDIRWKWQHSVAPTKVLRYSITFRTLGRNVRVPRSR